MLVDVALRRRAVLDEEIPRINARFVEQFLKLPGFWGKDKTASDAPNDFSGEGAALDLRKALQPGLSGQALYVPRFPAYVSKDVAQSDDFLNIRVDTDKANYTGFVRETLPRLIEIFGCYRAATETDEVVRRSDNAASRQQSKATGLNMSGRDGVYRIWPVCYFDELLCQRAFGMGASDVVARVAAECEHAETLNGGAFLIVTLNALTGPDLDPLNARVMARLGKPTIVHRQAG